MVKQIKSISNRLLLIKAHNDLLIQAQNREVFFSLIVKCTDLVAVAWSKASQVALILKNPLPMRRHKRCGFDSWVGKIPWRRKWLPPPVFLPGESHGQRSLANYSP